MQEGLVKLSVLSRTGKDAVVAMLGPRAFFGESALMGRPVRQEMATAVTAVSRSRVNAFMGKFKKLGFIEYDRSGLTIKDALLTVITGDQHHKTTDSVAS